ncbi:MAG: carbamoyltransferase [Alphaproteobacteria bacterium]|nr:carbamoyltransferase [Alphaproteobacteria bacterium]
MTSANTYILGISAYYHDSAAALLSDGEVLAAAQEERFTRKKHDARFPTHAVRYCLREANLSLSDIDYLVFYDKPFVKFERILETYLNYAPSGVRSFVSAMPIWLKEKLYLKWTLKQELSEIGGPKAKESISLLFAEHHQSHAASAFFLSPFENAAVLCLDGAGEWATTSAWHGRGNKLQSLWEIDFPHSLGLLYSSFTYFTGFRVNSGEYKLMGLAPYGEPRYVELMRNRLIDIKEDGTFRLNMEYFDYCTGLAMTNWKFESLFGRPRRVPEADLTQDDMDIAASIQVVTEQIILRLASTLHRETGEKYLCLAGGVALNCVANSVLVRDSAFDDIWIQPAAGDAGGSIGSAAVVWHEYLGHPRVIDGSDRMQGSFLGPQFSIDETVATLERFGARYRRLEEETLLDRLAEVLESGAIVGWFQGRMEFGPRALGARSIVGDPRKADMQSIMNSKIKFRESFRPFAPSVLEERATDYFEIDRPSPYMLLVAPVRDDIRVPMTRHDRELTGLERLNVPRSRIPAVTHVDYSSRVQTVSSKTNPRYHRLLKVFEARTDCGVLVNTSFNVRGEPIVCTPEDAYRCFMRTEMDFLVIDDILLSKTQQPEWIEDSSWKESIAPD